MRYFVDVPQKQADEVNKLIQLGKYQSMAQFILTAVENQIYLENLSELPQQINLGKNNNEISANLPIEANSETKSIMLNEIKSEPKTVSMPFFSDLSASLPKIDEEKCWLWGQTDKILPIKIGLRVLYSIMGTEQWEDLEEFREKATNIAAWFGSVIRNYEDNTNKVRNERISAGLPKGEKFKSKLRYKSQFLAYMRKDNKLDGAMPFLKFVNLMKDERGKILIGLTKAGLNFAKLENPVIDHYDFKKSFNDKEIEFYMEHISSDVKGENSAIKWLLTKVVNGITEREAMNNEVKIEFGQTWNASDKVINTQRSGLIGRMFELGLVNKEKTGIRVKFSITPSGEFYLKNN
jgi:Arc/MetJ-type ribon-helix-helix transcriptional regulator